MSRRRSRGRTVGRFTITVTERNKFSSLRVETADNDAFEQCMTRQRSRSSPSAKMRLKPTLHSSFRINHLAQSLCCHRKSGDAASCGSSGLCTLREQTERSLYETTPSNSDGLEESIHSTLGRDLTWQLSMLFHEVVNASYDMEGLRKAKRWLCLRHANKRFDLKSLSRLRILSLSGRGLARVCPEVCLVSTLVSLDLSLNRISALPPEIELLIQLRELDVQENQLKALPSEVGKLHELRELTLSGNRFSKFPPELCKLNKLEVLKLSGNRLTSLPEEMKSMTNLKMLNLEKNQLVSLPEQLGSLEQLSSLNVGCNQLVRVPLDNIKLNHRLQEIYLDRNRLVEIPKEIEFLANLQRLHLEHNELRSLPKEITRLPHLKRLFIRGNKTIKLSSELKEYVKSTWRSKHGVLR